MTKGNKHKMIVALIISLFVLGLIYVFCPYRPEYYGYSNKVLAHRVNSLEKLAFAEKFYAGVELDLMYNINTHSFDVNHPPAPSIGLDLETYLSHIKNKNIKLWLDIKNISKENAADAAQSLSKQITNAGINKKNILVESPEIPYLYFFKDEGFKTSFYLPYFLYKKDKQTLSKTIDSLKSLKEQYSSDGISADVLNYDILNQYFKKDKKFLWAIYPSYSRHQINNYTNFRKYASDPTVEIILVKVALPIGER